MSRLFLVFEKILTEGRLEDIKSKYPVLATNGIIDKLSEVDPSGNNKYLAWMTREVDKGESIKDVIQAIQDFHKNLQRLTKKDIYQYKNIKEIFDAIEKIGKSKTQQKKEFLINAPKFAETAKYVIYLPETQEASCILGKGTKWCISADENNLFNTYSNRGAKFAFVFDKSLESNDPNYKRAISVIPGKPDPFFKLLKVFKSKHGALPYSYSSQKMSDIRNLVKRSFNFNKKISPRLSWPTKEEIRSAIKTIEIDLKNKKQVNVEIFNALDKKLKKDGGLISLIGKKTYYQVINHLFLKSIENNQFSKIAKGLYPDASRSQIIKFVDSLGEWIESWDLILYHPKLDKKTFYYLSKKFKEIEADWDIAPLKADSHFMKNQDFLYSFLMELSINRSPKYLTSITSNRNSKFILGRNEHLLPKQIEKLIDMTIEDPETWYWLACGLASNPKTPKSSLIKMIKIPWPRRKKKPNRIRSTVGSGPRMIALANPNIESTYLDIFVDMFNDERNFHSYAYGIATNPNTQNKTLKKISKAIRLNLYKGSGENLKWMKRTLRAVYKHPNWVKKQNF